MTREKALEVLRGIDKKILLIKHIDNILEWDQDTVMPTSAGEERGEQYALLSSLMHNYLVSDELGSALETLSSDKELLSEERALARFYNKTRDREISFSDEFVQEKSKAINAAHYGWLKAREQGDFSLYEDSLKRIFSLTKEEARLIDPDKNEYDTLLDFYEEGMDTKIIDSLFSQMEKDIHQLMDEFASVDVDDSFLYKPYDEKSLHSFCLDVSRSIGFDFDRGVVGITAHPYTSAMGDDDHRISTRYTDDGLFDPIGSIIHESGHAMYNMAASKNPKIRGTRLAKGVSMGMHESQSRFWENIIGRSYSFWHFQYPLLQKKIPGLRDVSLDSFVKAINKTKPSAIRVNADELTYNLHIILRYKIEKELFDGSLSIHELPQRWNELSKEIVRYEVKSDKEGVLQDVHWSQGSFGYFPTYAIGNIYSAQFYKAMCHDLGGEDVVSSYLENGEYLPITNWQREKIWTSGSIIPPSELLYKVTGDKVDVAPFKEYLVKKFTNVYLN